ncbi:MAG: DUF2079 domain-containing protein [Armatimonadetes bacterium]|nr:DUF2079 domain-containing protein [Armatimonadota bacterium]
MRARINEQSDSLDLPRDGRHSLRMERGCLVLLWLAMVSYVVLFLRQSLNLLHHFGLTAFDLGIYDQAAWLISRFHTPFVTVRGMNIFADHFAPILCLLAPLYWIWDSPKAILVAQTVALALGAAPVYALTRRRMDSAPLALLFSLAYLCYPPMQWSNTFDFHPDVFATPLLLAAFYLLACGRWRLYFLMLTLAAMSKETAGLTIALLGMYALRLNRRIGWMTIGLGVFSLALALGVIRKLNHGTPSPYFWLYSGYGNSPGEIISTMVRHPGAFLTSLDTQENRQYFFELLQPVLFLPLLAPEVLLLASPAILSNLMSNRFYMHQIYYQYTSLITPFVTIAAMIGFERLRRWGNPVNTTILTFYLMASIASGLRLSPFFRSEWPLSQPLPSSESREAERILRLVPASATVSAQASVVPHLSHRRQIYLFPNPFYRVSWGGTVAALKQQMGTGYPPHNQNQMARAIASSTIEYVALQPRGAIFPLTPEKNRTLSIDLLRHQAYGIVAIGENIILLRRGADRRRGFHLLAKQTGVPIASERDIAQAFRVMAGLTPPRSAASEAPRRQARPR